MTTPLDKMFPKFTKLDAEEFQEFVATGAEDEAVATWITKHAKERDEKKIAKWNWKQRCALVSSLEADRQLFVQNHVEEHVPADKRGRMVGLLRHIRAEESRM